MMMPPLHTMNTHLQLALGSVRFRPRRSPLPFAWAGARPPMLPPPPFPPSQQLLARPFHSASLPTQQAAVIAAPAPVLTDLITSILPVTTVQHTGMVAAGHGGHSGAWWAQRNSHIHCQTSMESCTKRCCAKALLCPQPPI